MLWKPKHEIHLYVKDLEYNKWAEVPFGSEHSAASKLMEDSKIKCKTRVAGQGNKEKERFILTFDSTAHFTTFCLLFADKLPLRIVR